MNISLLKLLRLRIIHWLGIMNNDLLAVLDFSEWKNIFAINEATVILD